MRCIPGESGIINSGRGVTKNPFPGKRITCVGHCCIGKGNIVGGTGTITKQGSGIAAERICESKITDKNGSPYRLVKQELHVFNLSLIDAGKRTKGNTDSVKQHLG